MQDPQRTSVPEPPAKPVVIAPVDLQRIDAWITYFEQMSKRVIVFKRDDLRLPELIKTAEFRFRRQKTIGETDVIDGWPPDIKDIAFAVNFSETNPTTEMLFDPEKMRLFCFGGQAFSVSHFTCEDTVNTDKKGWHSIWSLRSYTLSALGWEHVASCIAAHVIEIERRYKVPKVPKARK